MKRRFRECAAGPRAGPIFERACGKKGAGAGDKISAACLRFLNELALWCDVQMGSIRSFCCRPWGETPHQTTDTSYSKGCSLTQAPVQCVRNLAPKQ